MSSGAERPHLSLRAPNSALHRTWPRKWQVASAILHGVEVQAGELGSVSQPMKTAPTCALAILLLTTCRRVEINQRASGDQAIDALCSTYVNAISRSDFANASRLFHYPPAETGSALAKDRATVALEGAVFQERFGKLEQIRVDSSPPVFEVSFGGGDLRYWQVHQDVVRRTCVVHFSKWGVGRVTFDACKIGPSWQLRSVHYGLPVSGSESAARVAAVSAEVIRRVTSG